MIQDRPKSIAIANPRAGKIRSTRLGSHRLPNACDWRETMHAGHAEELAYQASCQGHDLVIAVGGDGTVHEVLNGLLRNPGNRSALGILPVGTANDYATAIGKQWEGESSDSHRVDIGRMTWNGHTRYFANVTGIGFSGLVAARARRMLRVPARLRYTLALLSHMGPTYGATLVSMAIDNETISETPRLMLSIGIGTHEGSYPLNPTARLDDGWFDVLELRSLRRRDIARYFPGMLQGHIPKDHSSIHTYRARSIAIESSSLVPFHLDGEFPRGVSPHGLNAFVVELIPHAIDVQLF